MDNITTSQQAQRREKQIELDARVRNVAGKIQEKFGYSAPMLAGILGNIHVETGNTFDYKQKQNKGPAEGLFQFDFFSTMKESLRVWFTSSGLAVCTTPSFVFAWSSLYLDRAMISQCDALMMAMAVTCPADRLKAIVEKQFVTHCFFYPIRKDIGMHFTAHSTNR